MPLREDGEAHGVLGDAGGDCVPGFCVEEGYRVLERDGVG